MTDQFDSALDLLRRLNPKNTARNLTDVCKLAPAIEEELLASVDTPLTVRACKASGRDYLLCDYNRDGDSYRSPWSNKFDPPLDDAEYSSDRVRNIEVKVNEALDVYRELYYETGVSSAYFWDVDDGYAGVLLIKKSGPSSSVKNTSGSWDSIHVVEVTEKDRKERQDKARYKVTSTVILKLGCSGTTELGTLDLNGNMTRQVESELAITDDASHVANMGKLVEDMESKMRNLLQEVYFGKAKDIVSDLRSLQSLSSANKDRETQQQVMNSMQSKA